MEKKKESSSQPQKQKESKHKETGMVPFVHYSGLGFQMVAVILLFYWAGSKLDERLGSEKPVYTAILTVLGVFAGLYIVLKPFIFRKDD